MSECVFCDRVRNGEFWWEGFNCVAFTPLNPVILGHTLVVPKRHVPHFAWDGSVSADAMRAAAFLAHQHQGEYNLITSLGKNATQTIMHLHLHLVPRYEDDGLHLPWTGQKKG
jgi:histidine triad (HIT) family protein